MGAGKYANLYLRPDYADDGSDAHDYGFPDLGSSPLGYIHRGLCAVRDHAFGGIYLGASLSFGTCVGVRHLVGGLLSRGCVEQHHVLPLQRGCGLFGGYDLRLDTVGSGDDSLANAVDGGRDY